MSSLKVLTRRVDTNRVFDLQRQQKYEIIPLTGVVPASAQTAVRVTISNQGHFYCQGLTGSFTTLYGPGGIGTDDGVNHLRGQLYSDNDPIFNDFVPFDLFCSPGRRKSPVDLTGTPGNALFVPFTLEYLFPANSVILMNTINDGTFENRFDLAFVGIRCSAYETVAGVKRQS